MPQMREWLAKSGVSDIRSLGPLPQTALAGLMSRSHVLVLPSVQDGLGMVITQAMAAGVP